MNLLGSKVLTSAEKNFHFKFSLIYKPWLALHQKITFAIINSYTEFEERIQETNSHPNLLKPRRVRKNSI